MKRMLIAALAVTATAAFAAPAGAQTDVLYADADAVACNKPATECARDLALWVVEQTDPETLVNRVFDTVNQAGPIIGDACEIVFPSCSLPTP